MARAAATAAPPAAGSTPPRSPPESTAPCSARWPRGSPGSSGRTPGRWSRWRWRWGGGEEKAVLETERVLGEVVYVFKKDHRDESRTKSQWRITLDEEVDCFLR